ncbi:MAG: anti-sigma factor family protein, partial [Terriglobales bacterium]
MQDDLKNDGGKNKDVKSNDMSKKEIGVSQHPFDQEELMAFLDGELPAERAASAAAHLKNCLDCQKLAAGFQQVSQAMVSWEVERTSSEIPASVAAALNERKKDPARKLNSQRWEWRKLLRVQQLTWAAGLAAATLLVIAVSMPSLLRSNKGAIESARMGQLRQETESRALKPDQEEAQKKSQNQPSAADKKFAQTYIDSTKKFGPEYGRNAGSVTKVVPKNGAAALRKSRGKAADANGNVGGPGLYLSSPEAVATYTKAPPPPKPAATPVPGDSLGLVAPAAAPVAKVNRDFRSAAPAEISKQSGASGGAAKARKDSRQADETVNVTASASTVEVE